MFYSKNLFFKFAIAGLALLSAQVCYSETIFISKKVTQSPMIDGKGGDVVWKEAKPITAFDKLLPNAPIEIASVYDEKYLYFKVKFPDSKEDREHKTMNWNNETKRYINGPKREDIFVFKWNMEKSPVDLSLDSDESYMADIWYWKSHRTDHASVADDKYQKYQKRPIKRATKLINSKGNIFYLTRKGDNGKSAYKTKFVINKDKENMPRFDFRKPEGSRADIKAKGLWEKGYWTVEFKRALNTGHDDDLQFNPNSNLSYQFGISLHEIAGRKPNNKMEKPNFGSGDINKTFQLKFQ